MVTKTSRELGIMFGFIGVFIFVFLGFAIAHHISSKRNAEKELQRARELTERGFSEKGALEKGNDYA